MIIQSSSTLQDYAHSILVQVPWVHWAIMVGVSLALMGVLLAKKKSSVYGTVVFGVTLFMGLLLLDTTVVNRCLGTLPISSGYELSLRNFFYIPERRWVEFFANVAVFVPFGFFLSEVLANMKRLRPWRRLALATLSAFCLSLCIECFQLILHVGFFELTDLVLNTLGGFIGAGLSVVGRTIWAQFQWRRGNE